tara:strand:- start:293 stop:466 length:174 start_codon:yes stop_codon:yes gene_type:complete
MKEYTMFTSTLNPVSKVRIIVDNLTDDNKLQNKLLEILTRKLTVTQINKLYENNQQK